MPAIEFMTTPLDPTLDRLSSKIQEIRDRKSQPSESSLDSAMDMVSSNSGRQEARSASTSVQGLSMEMVQQGAEAHVLDPAMVASLIADPFDD